MIGPINWRVIDTILMYFHFILQNAQTKDVKAIEFEETTSATTLKVSYQTQGIIFVIFSMLVVLFLWAVILS